MKAIILAGGFAVRLLPLTKYIPKPLLPIAGKPVIDYIVEQLNQIPAIDEIIVSTNQYYENNFRYWLGSRPANSKKISLVCECSINEKQKLGAIAALQYVIQTWQLDNDESLVVAGDNIFEFKLDEFINFYKSKNQPVIALCDLRERDSSELKHFGLGIMDEQQKVIDFQEKPQQPRSTCAATGCYIYPPHISHFLVQYLEDKNNPDAPGYFVEWLYKRVPVYAFIFNQTWYDIGSLESYDRVNQYFKAKLESYNQKDK